MRTGLDPMEPTPTQPTPEELEVQETPQLQEAAQAVLAQSGKEFADDPRSYWRAHLLADALLTQQSQERAALREIDAEIKKGRDGAPASIFYIEQIVDAALAASPGKGAEGEAGNV